MKSALRTDKESIRRKRERVLMLAAGVLIGLLSLAEYFLISHAAPLPTSSNVLIFAVINLNILLILVLSFLVVRNLVKLVFEDRKNLLGAKLRTKLVIAFVSLSLIPTLVLFFVSFQFLRTSLEYWFDVKVERSLNNALTVGKIYYKDQVGELKRVSQALGRAVSMKCIDESGRISRSCLEDLINPAPLLPGRQALWDMLPLSSVEVLGPALENIYVKTWLPMVGSPPMISASAMAQKLTDQDYGVFTSVLENGELLRVVRPLQNTKGQVVAYLCLGRLIPQDMGQLLEEIRSGYEDYRQLKLFQDPIKVTLLITLFLITLLILFVSIWFGFRLARGITEPVQMLADATHRIAQGDLDFSLEVQGRDELSSLVRAFNTMTQDLKEAKRRAEDASRQLLSSYAELEHRRRYMEILLQNVTTGVISIDRKGAITTVNRSAEEILSIPASKLVGKPYKEILTPAQAEEFEEIRQELLESAKGTLQRPIRLTVGDKTLSLVVNFTVLRDQEDRSLGVVVVFDDLTELERIQRIAAWREVARRIAHEVKNPLTPIKLSAQRLRKKYMDKLDTGGQKVLERCTNTIISQVEELRRLVDEFSRFARMPAPRMMLTDLRELADEVISMYREGNPAIEFSIDAHPDLSRIKVDPDQIKRVLVNLVENAVSAMPDGGRVKILITTNDEADQLVLEVCDTGVGIDASDRSRLFEPYFSKRKGGTGLGLAIVNSIISDHNGTITVEENRPKGTRFVIRLPI